MQGLKEKFKDYFHIGAAVNVRSIQIHDELIKKHFDSITCDNAMKYISVCNNPNQYNFEYADKIYEYAKKNNMVMRGHNFVWHNQTPDWLFKNKDRKELLEQLANHVKLVGGHYQELIYAWDVINEAIEDRTDQYLRQTKWKEVLGDNYIHEVFCLVKDNLPNCQLFYNDYNEYMPSKKDKIVKMVKEQLAQGTPIEGIGLQCHISIERPTMDEMKRAIEEYAKLGLRIHITEMDVSMYKEWLGKQIENPSEKLFEQQAMAYKNAFKVFMEYHDVIDNVTLWGVADDLTWLDDFPVEGRKNWPLLFDVNHQPKKAFYEIMNL